MDEKNTYAGLFASEKDGYNRNHVDEYLSAIEKAFSEFKAKYGNMTKTLEAVGAENELLKQGNSNLLLKLKEAEAKENENRPDAEMVAKVMFDARLAADRIQSEAAIAAEKIQAAALVKAKDITEEAEKKSLWFAHQAELHKEELRNIHQVLTGAVERLGREPHTGGDGQ